MEAVAAFCLLLIIYFLGSLAVIQLVIRPIRKLTMDAEGNKKVVETNHLKILLISILLSLATTILAYNIFL